MSRRHDRACIDEPIVGRRSRTPTDVAHRPRRHARPSIVRPRSCRRIVRRPRHWLDAPWTNERIVRYLTALILVGGATFSVLKVVHLNLVFENNTPTGGDMGAHVMAPGVPARSPAAALPAQRLEQLLVRRLPAVPLLHGGAGADDRRARTSCFPYGVAFKIVAILGLVTLPVCCWAFGRLARFRYPMPELMALAGLIFLFDESFSIYGGNVKSTMAGEFSFSIALSFAILGLGLFARGLETGKYRSWAAILLALAMLCHGIVLIFVVLGAVLLWLDLDGPHAVHLRRHDGARRRRCCSRVLGRCRSCQPRST